MIDFYGQMFSLQEEALGHIHLPFLAPSADLLKVKAKDHFPLLSLADFKIDKKGAQDLFAKICRLSDAADDGLRSAAQRLKAAVDKRELQLEDLFKGLLTENDALFQATAERLQIDAPALIFICYHSLRPSIIKCAEQVQAHLEERLNWEKGYCPICGSLPGLSVLDDAGKRALVCGFCWHHWSINRQQCPFCENQDHKSLKYFYSEDEKEYRVETCDACMTYLKSIDIRLVDRPLYLPLDQVSSLHLDVKAQELGFGSGLKIDLQG
jgi:FdhE protein